MKSEHKELTQYFSQQTELIKEIHQQLTEHLDQRFTIAELSKQYLINTSTLKEIFKAVYGQPIATYMKEYRVRQAMKLLRETDASIADIANQVGYETQGKFSKAFKDVVQVLPTEYRKMHHQIWFWLPRITGVDYKNLNRIDDPLGANKDKLCYSEKRTEAYVKSISVSGTYKTEYLTDEKFDETGTCFFFR